MPPIGPTLPSASIVPVPAMILPPVRSSGLILSIIPRASIRPADGPPTFSIGTVNVNGAVGVAVAVNAGPGLILVPSAMVVI